MKCVLRDAIAVVQSTLGRVPRCCKYQKPASRRMRAMDVRKTFVDCGQFHIHNQINSSSSI